MKYITTAEAAKKWGVTRDRVLKLAQDGRIENVVQIGTRWMIPENVAKPSDARIRNKKRLNNNLSNSFFRYPNFESRDINSFDPPLNYVEIRIKKMCEAFQACEFLEAEKILKTILEEKLNINHRIFILRCSCYIYYELFMSDRFFESYKKLSIELSKNFPYKKELSTLIHEIDATIGKDSYFVNEFNIDYSYSYLDSFKPHLAALSMISFSSSSDQTLTEKDLMPYEYILSSIENEESYVDIQSMHIYLGIEYGKLLDVEKMKYHFAKALEIAEKYKLYYQIAMFYYYYPRSFDIALKEFSNEFIKKIKSLSKDLHERYLKFMRLSSLDNIYSKLPSKDYLLVYFALQGYTSKEVSSILHISESNVGNKYSVIYQTLGIHNKNELIEYYKKSTSTDIERKKK